MNFNHVWNPAPHYANIKYNKETDRMYWWCVNCEKHKFQKTEPRINEKCPIKVQLGKYRALKKLKEYSLKRGM